EEDRDVLKAGPDHAQYWNIWDYVLVSARVIVDGVVCQIYQRDGDVFAVRADAFWSDADDDWLDSDDKPC
ncbi:MAG: hypothetical protein ACO35B_06465, partial [Luminiphilus sp.]